MRAFVSRLFSRSQSTEPQDNAAEQRAEDAAAPEQAPLLEAGPSRQHTGDLRQRGTPAEADTRYDYVQLDDTTSSSDTDEGSDTMNDIYNLGVTDRQDKAALYGRMMHYYAEKTGTVPPMRSKSVLWYMLAILISNPIIGLYTMTHFKDWDKWITKRAASGELQINAFHKEYPIVNPTTTQNIFRASKPNKIGALAEDGAIITDDGLERLSLVAKHLSGEITWYAWYEVFGELLFALFSLALLCASGICCANGRQRAQYMIPMIGLMYTAIYKVLAMYILIISFKILHFYVVAAFPKYGEIVPAVILRMLAIPGTDPTDPMQREAMSYLLALDTCAHRWVLVYCLENVYITITDSVETIQALSRILMRTVKKLVRKLKRQQDLVYFTMNPMVEAQASVSRVSKSSCSYLLLDSLLNRTADPQEAYIHDMYNKPGPDVGTYLDNIKVEQYQDGIARIGPKLMSQLRNSDKRVMEATP
ncbi:transcription initiation factor [Babesia ovata]|uniref:Transcription initiation factor n=1 Tax=Babesia ovata TaxID=189622 RepID=A0A2H6KA60_9APIC|nr:transcription initiation factor [Babesia ovata]GBE59839.1 transcription initiation factor [Babesia ovata]